VRAPDRARGVARAGRGEHLAAVDDEQGRGAVGGLSRDEALGVARVPRQAEVELRSRGGAPPGGKRGAPQLGREDALDRLGRAGGELGHEIRDRAGAADLARHRIGGPRRVPQGARQVVERRTLLDCELDQERLRIERAIAGGAPGRAPGRAAGHQSLQRGVRVGAGETCGAGDGVPGGRPQLEQGGVHERLGGGEAERSEVDRGHT